MTEEDLVISKTSSNLVKDKIHLVLQFWFTKVTFETETIGDEDLQISDQNKQWLKLSAKEKSDIDKAKEFIKALCNPELAEIVEIDENLRKKTNQDYLDGLTEKYRVHFTILDKNLVVQGKNENVASCLTDLRLTPLNHPNDSKNNLKYSKFTDFLSAQSAKNASRKRTELNEDVFEIDDEIEWLENMKKLTPDTYLKISSKKTDQKKSPDMNHRNLKETQNPIKQSTIEFDATSNDDNSNKRHIIIDASNVAVEHGKVSGRGRCFSCKGIKLAVDYFKNRGHTKITAFLPRYRRGSSDHQCPTLNPEILDDLENKGYISYTPSRRIEKKLVISYDDRFILKAAQMLDGIIVSNDNYRDLQQENPEWINLVNKNLLQFSFIGDIFLIADDPLGRSGPSIDEFLSKKNGPNKSNKSNEINNNFSKSNRNHQNKNSNKNSKFSSLNSYSRSNTNNAEINATTSLDTASAEGAEATPELEEINPRDETISGDLFLSLIEIFPDSGDAISDLLRSFPNETNIDFFTQRLLNID